MEKEFIPYEQSLALKELGFDEPCMAYYRKNNPTLKFGEGFELVTREEYRNVMHYPLINSRYVAGNNAPDGYYYLTTSPTFSQAFRWFREKYDISSVVAYHNLWKYSYHLYDIKKAITITVEDNYKTYEESEIECLKKLIEIVNEKKYDRDSTNTRTPLAFRRIHIRYKQVW